MFLISLFLLTSGNPQVYRFEDLEEAIMSVFSKPMWNMVIPTFCDIFLFLLVCVQLNAWKLRGSSSECYFSTYKLNVMAS